MSPLARRCALRDAETDAPARDTRPRHGAPTRFPGRARPGPVITDVAAEADRGTESIAPASPKKGDVMNRKGWKYRAMVRRAETLTCRNEAFDERVRAIFRRAGVSVHVSEDSAAERYGRFLRAVTQRGDDEITN